MKPEIVTPTLMRCATGEPSALQLCATKLVEGWALLNSARAEAEHKGDDRAASVLAWVGSALTLPDGD